MPLSDILACSDQHLEAILNAENPYKQGAWFLAKNIAMIELCKLGELLGVGSYDSLNKQFKLIGEPLPEGPWPQSIPRTLTDRLKQINDPEVEKVCVAWSEIEEFHGTAIANSLADYLKRLRDFLSANDGPYFLVNAL